MNRLGSQEFTNNYWWLHVASLRLMLSLALTLTLTGCFPARSNQSPANEPPASASCPDYSRSSRSPQEVIQEIDAICKQGCNFAKYRSENTLTELFIISATGKNQIILEITESEMFLHYGATRVHIGSVDDLSYDWRAKLTTLRLSVGDWQNLELLQEVVPGVYLPVPDTNPAPRAPLRQSPRMTG